MRVAILSDASNPTPTPGGHGLGFAVWQLAELLRQRGHDVHLFAGAGSRFSGEHTVTLKLSTPGTYDAENHLAQAAYIIHKAQPFDAFLDCGHIHLLARLFPHLPVVNVYHDIWQPYERCAVVLSHGQRALLPAQFDTARVIHNAINPALYPPALEADDPPYALFMGLFADYKQPLLAIEAAAKAGIKLVMAGGGQPPIERYSNVEYVGPVVGARKRQLLRGARVFLQLGHSESFGLTTVEAGLSGTPVVAWPTGGTVDLVKHGCNGAMIPIGSGDKVKAVADTITRAWSLDRGQVASYTASLMDVDAHVRAYEQALDDCAKGVWW